MRFEQQPEIAGPADVPAALIEKYDRPGPRYTSYPTAVEFDERVGAATYADLLGRAATRAEDPLSLYLHLPFCQEMCHFCACHVVISPHYANALPYIDRLGAEIDLVAEHLGRRRGVAQLHLGGGTPTYYSPPDLARLLDRLWRRFDLLPGAEVAIEVDPRVTTTEHLDVLAAAGFNRLSMGVQDLEPDVQVNIGRVQSRASTERLLEHARDLGFQGLNVDLIYGLPGQTGAGFGRTVEQIIEMGVDRIALYSFAFVPWMKAHQNRLDNNAFPSRDEKFALFLQARERFLDAGYAPIGMDHFARRDDELARARARHELRRNFQGYSVIPAPDVIGLGVSAIGDVEGAYVQNVKKLSEYGEAMDAGRLAAWRGVPRSDDDEVRRAVIHELMCNFRIDVAAIETTYGIEFADYFATDLELLREPAADGLVEVATDVLRATPLGALFIRNLAMCFDRYWREKHADRDRPVFSRTV